VASGVFRTLLIPETGSEVHDNTVTEIPGVVVLYFEIPGQNAVSQRKGNHSYLLSGMEETLRMLIST
jgi:hypothetical protein